MAEIDKAPLPYRAVIEFWWWLDKNHTRASVNYIHQHDDDDPPVWFQKIGSFFYVQRKQAERRALRKIGYIR